MSATRFLPVRKKPYTKPSGGLRASWPKDVRYSSQHEQRERALARFAVRARMPLEGSNRGR